jgi:hypothetical protein
MEAFKTVRNLVVPGRTSSGTGFSNCGLSGAIEAGGHESTWQKGRRMCIKRGSNVSMW